ncbi:MAG: CoA-transferase [Desulfuromonadales bacterium]|nr:CoA-transferase [Desulfuromonadales bacterium]
MYGIFTESVEEKLLLAGRETAGSKVMGLKEAVQSFVRTGMHLHIAHTYMRPNAAVFEICRSFWQKAPRFTISSLGFTGNMMLFVQGGLAQKLITTFCGDAYPFPGPNRIYQAAFQEGRVAIENWTVLTLVQRLLAGAMGVDWMPTHSISGSSLEEENADNLWVTSSPEGNKTIMVRAMNPDLTFVHAWAADPSGNLVLAPPYAEGPHGAFAAREGVVATVENVLTTRELKRYSHLVKIPGFLVRAVCPVPLGTHPAGASNHGVRDFEAYAEDEIFLQSLREACKDEEKTRAWVEEWLLDCPDHNAYLKKLGHDRIWRLKGRAATDSWQTELMDQVPAMTKAGKANPTETMILAASGLIKEKVKAENYRTILAGIGASNLAAWKSWYDLKRIDCQVDLMAEVGFFGYTPRPADPFIFNLRNIPTCSMLTDIITVLGNMVGSSSGRSIGVLGAGQIDQYGNINSTLIREMNLFLVGSGGACDVALGAQEVLVLIEMNPYRLVDRVSYITAPGERVRTLVTDLGVFEKGRGEEKLILTKIFNAGNKESDIIGEIKARCGWEIKIAPELETLSPPVDSDLMDIRIFDPERLFTAG